MGSFVVINCVRFLPQGHAADVFEAYSQLLTEMVLRLPYQIKKIADTNPRIPAPVFDHSWFYFLSEVDVLVCQTLTYSKYSSTEAETSIPGTVRSALVPNGKTYDGSTNKALILSLVVNYLFLLSFLLLLILKKSSH